MSEGKLIQHEAEIVREASARFQDFSSGEIAFLMEITSKWRKPISKEKARQFLQHCLAVHDRAYGIMRMRMVNNGKCKFLA